MVVPLQLATLSAAVSFRPLVCITKYLTRIPLAAGARQIATGLNIAKQYNQKVFVTSMCIGSGMGMAAVFVSEH